MVQTADPMQDLLLLHFIKGPGFEGCYAYALSRGPCCSNMEIMAYILRLTREEKDGLAIQVGPVRLKTDLFGLFFFQPEQYFFLTTTQPEQYFSLFNQPA